MTLVSGVKITIQFNTQTFLTITWSCLHHLHPFYFIFLQTFQNIGCTAHYLSHGWTTPGVVGHVPRGLCPRRNFQCHHLCPTLAHHRCRRGELRRGRSHSSCRFRHCPIQCHCSLSLSPRLRLMNSQTQIWDPDETNFEEDTSDGKITKLRPDQFWTSANTRTGLGQIFSLACIFNSLNCNDSSITITITSIYFSYESTILISSILILWIWTQRSQLHLHFLNKSFKNFHLWSV